MSPTEKFGFHINTCLGTLTQMTNIWEDFWEILYHNHLAHELKMDEEKHGVWPEFQHVCRLILGKGIPRLSRPTQSEGRSIKPCSQFGVPVSVYDRVRRRTPYSYRYSSTNPHSHGFSCPVNHRKVRILIQSLGLPNFIIASATLLSP